MKLHLVLPLSLATSSLALGLAIGACGTDNGSSVHGPTFGPIQRDASSDGASSGTSGSSGMADGDVPDGEGAFDASADGANPPCTDGTVAVLAGSATGMMGAVQTKGGAWTTSAIAGGGALSKPALVAFGPGFLGVTRGPGGALQSVSHGTSWSAAATFGVAGVKGPPALAVAGTNAHVVYSGGAGDAHEMRHGIHDGTAWNAADANVGSPPSHSFGTVGAAIAAAGTTLGFVENGRDRGLYTRVYDGAWSASSAVVGAGTVGNDLPAPPVMVAAEGKFDLVAVYVEKDTRRVAWAGRDAATKTWSDGDPVHPDATTAEPLSLARVGQLTLLVTFRGQSEGGVNNAYYVQGTIGATTITWTAAQPVGGGGKIAVDSAPAVARGVCGDDAVVVYASGGAVRSTRLRGTAWTPAETVAPAVGSPAYVAVATR